MKVPVKKLVADHVVEVPEDTLNLALDAKINPLVLALEDVLADYGHYGKVQIAGSRLLINDGQAVVAVTFSTKQQAWLESLLNRFGARASFTAHFRNGDVRLSSALPGAPPS